MATMPWIVEEANRQAAARHDERARDEAAGACPDCGSLSPWKCGCVPSEDEDDPEDGL